jgi:DNA-binding FadR family transcriptional regulator
MKSTTKKHSPSKVVTFKALPEKRTFKEIEKQIREMIYSGALKPGDKLPSENELASQFRVARPAVREALRTLEHAGFIVVKQGNTGGSYIKELDATVTAASLSDLMRQGDISLRHLTDARLAIEKLVLDKAFDSISNDHLLALEKCVQDLEGLAKEERQEGYPVDPTVTSFHLMLGQITDNPVFEIILRVLIEVTARLLSPTNIDPERLKEHGLSHRSLYEALKNRDRDRGLRILEEHMLEVEGLFARELGMQKKKERGGSKGGE